MSLSLNDATIVIRSANERTEPLCKKLILEQGVKEENLFIVREVPFSESMHKSFKIGINNRLPWTFCVDADVLLRPGSIEYMLKIADKQKNKVCEIQGMMLDKFFGGPRPVGIHLYRTSLLPEVLKRIPREGIDIRPEHYTLNKMKEDGFPWIKIPYIVGIHDEEQYNFDTYRKCFVHGVKHLHYVKLFVEIWKSKKEDDHDFRVALQALADCIINTETVFINKDQSLYKRLFQNNGFHEKAELDLNNYSLQKIESIITNWKEPDIYMEKFPTRWGLDKSEKSKNIKDIINDLGIIKSFPYIIGRGMLSLGHRIIKLSS